MREGKGREGKAELFRNGLAASLLLICRQRYRALTQEQMAHSTTTATSTHDLRSLPLANAWLEAWMPP